MRLQIPNTKTENIIIFDIEYDGPSLVQLAFLILTNKEPNIFEVSKSVNLYLRQNHPVNHFFTKYTNITNDFLSEEGIDLSVARTLVNDCLLNINANSCVVVSHGIKNDLELLATHGINFIDLPEHYCTYNAAKRLLKRNNNLKLQNIAEDSGYYMFNAHNAYADVWGTLHAFCYLKELESENT